MSVDLISVLHPYGYVCKQSDAAKSEGKLRRFRIYDIKVAKKDGLKLLKRLTNSNERTRQERDHGTELRQLVQRYIDRLRKEVADKFGDNANPAPIETFLKIAEDMLQRDPALFSFATTKRAEDCFVALVRKQLDKDSGEIEEMTIYFLQDGVKVSETAAQGGEEEGAVGGAVGGVPEEQQHQATLILLQEWKNSFARSLEKNIQLCHGHIGPALQALRLGHESYTDSEGKTCNFNQSVGNRDLVQSQARRNFKSYLNYKLNNMNTHGGSRLCKVHLNGAGSDCYLVYVAQTYMQGGRPFRVFLLVGVLTHSEVGIRTGSKKKKHATQKAGDRNIVDITEDMEAAEKYLR